MRFPIFKTKTGEPKFDLNNPASRRKYFEFKAGPEIRKLQEYLKKNTFIAYLLGKKNSGKGTYSKMLAEIFGHDKIDHFSVGDMMREIDKELKNKKSKEELVAFFKKEYRGWSPLGEIIPSLEKRSTKTLLSTELILALIKREIAKRKKKAIFIDGFPRNLDQVSLALFFRDLVGYRDDPDIFVLIDVPESVINERIKWRRICPFCQTSRNLKLLPTSKISYDKKKKEFYLICDNPKCKGAKMISKEGDESGIKPIKKRLKDDEKIIDKVLSLQGIPKVLLRNSIPVKEAKKFVDEYEITPEYVYQWDEKEKKVITKERSWVIPDDEGEPSYSLLAPPVAVSLIKQIVEVLSL